MKLKGRRQSTNVEDRTNDPDIIPDGAKVLAGPFGNVKAPIDRDNTFRWDSKTMDSRDQKIKKELSEKDEYGRTPIPTPKPTQVTPGNWSEKKANFRGKKK